MLHPNPRLYTNIQRNRVKKGPDRDLDTFLLVKTCNNVTFQLKQDGIIHLLLVKLNL